MNGSEEIEGIIEKLQLLIDREPGTPAVVVMGPGLGDASEALRGNRGGFLHLAAAALKAAEGQEQNFDKAAWINQYEYDWSIRRLTPDADANSYFPKPSTGLTAKLWSLLKFALLLLILVCLIVGATTIVRWL